MLNPCHIWTCFWTTPVFTEIVLRLSESYCGPQCHLPPTHILHCRPLTNTHTHRVYAGGQCAHKHTCTSHTNRTRVATAWYGALNERVELIRPHSWHVMHLIWVIKALLSHAFIWMENIRWITHWNKATNTHAHVFSTCQATVCVKLCPFLAPGIHTDITWLVCVCVFLAQTVIWVFVLSYLMTANVRDGKSGQ